MTLHSKVPLGQRHSGHNWEYADAAARAAAGGFTAEDVGKTALQLDDFSSWVLTTHAVPTWAPQGAGTAGAILANGSVPFTGDQSMGGNNLTGLAAASANGEAVRFDEFDTIVTRVGDVEDRATDLEDYSTAVKGATFEPGGFPPQQIPRCEVLFDDLTRQVTLQPKAPALNYQYFNAGEMRSSNAPKTLIISADEGFHYVYLDAADNLAEMLTFDPTFFQLYVPICAIYWDSVAGAHIYLGDERHGCAMDGATHTLLHFTIGPTVGIGGGLALLDVVADGDGSTDDHCQFGVEGGLTVDQDISHLHATDAKPATMGGYYVLTVAPSVHVFRELAAGNYPFAVSGGHAAFNQYAGGAWSLQPVADDHYMCSHVFATNDASRPFAYGVGRAEYNTLAEAFEGAGEELKALTQLIITTMPCVEFVPLGSVILHHDHTYANTYKVAVQSTPLGDDWIDWRFSKLSVSVPTASLVHTHQASDILMPTQTPSDKLRLLSQWINYWPAPRGVAGFGLTDLGTGSVGIAAGEVMVRDGATTGHAIYGVFIAATASLTPTDGAVSYIYARWNGGSPDVVVSTTPPSRTDQVLLHVVARYGTTLKVLSDVTSLFSADGSLHDALRSAAPVVYKGGTGLTATGGGLKVALSAGTVAAGAKAVAHAAIDTSGAGSFTTAYKDGGTGWTRTAGQTTVNVTNYDDGSGVLAALTADYYVNRWLYLVLHEGAAYLVLVYGQAEHETLGEALSEAEPAAADLPPECRWPGLGALVARITVQDGATAFAAVDQPHQPFRAIPATSGGGGGGTAEVVILEEQQNAGVHGGASTGGAWQTRVLNTTINPEAYAWFLALAANEFDLDEGKYLIRASAPAVAAGRHQLRLRNVTGAPATELVGQSVTGAYFAEEDTSFATVEGLVSVAAGSEVFRLEHWIERAVASYGLGYAASRSVSDGPGEDEIYTRVTIMKVG